METTSTKEPLSTGPTILIADPAGSLIGMLVGLVTGGAAALPLVRKFAQDLRDFGKCDGCGKAFEDKEAFGCTKCMDARSLMWKVLETEPKQEEKKS